jgi:hypothetical protein
MGIQIQNEELFMSTKVGVDGKPYDPAERARTGLDELRGIIESHYRAASLTSEEYISASGSLASIADRLQTCDALERKLDRVNKPGAYYCGRCLTAHNNESECQARGSR